MEKERWPVPPGACRAPGRGSSRETEGHCPGAPDAAPARTGFLLERPSLLLLRDFLLEMQTAQNPSPKTFHFALKSIIKSFN